MAWRGRMRLCAATQPRPLLGVALPSWCGPPAGGLSGERFAGSSRRVRVRDAAGPPKQCGMWDQRFFSAQRESSSLTLSIGIGRHIQPASAWGVSKRSDSALSALEFSLDRLTGHLGDSTSCRDSRHASRRACCDVSPIFCGAHDLCIKRAVDAAVFRCRSYISLLDSWL